MASSAEERPLSLFDAACIGVNAIVGSSIFLFPGSLAGYLGPASILSFGVTGILLAPVAACFALAARGFDRPGGPYLYATTAFGPLTGFAVGWMCLMAEIFSWAAVANGIANYLTFFSPAWGSALAVKGVAAFVIVFFAALNYRGVKLGAIGSDAMAVAKLLPLAVFILAGLPRVNASAFVPFAPHGWAQMGKACFLAFFAFSGFEVVPVPAGEVKNPGRNVPIALAASMGLATALYMAVQAVAVGTLPALASSPRPLADAAAAFLGPWGAALMVLGAVVSTTGFTAGSALGGPRYLVALAQDAHLPTAAARPHERFGTPHLAILWTAGPALAAAVLLDFSKLVDFTLVVICVQYVGTCAALPLLARNADPAGRPAPGWQWLLAAAGAGATLWLGAQGGVKEILWACGALALGFLLRWAARRAPRS
ncbi:MAG: amino acid permease [Elusimicrobia bacterium]|nr:amino acid permease [Elusimicrobiota bacterium]